MTADPLAVIKRLEDAVAAGQGQAAYIGVDDVAFVLERLEQAKAALRDIVKTDFQPFKDIALEGLASIPKEET